jgi:hypothetical protein
VLEQELEGRVEDQRAAALRTQVGGPPTPPVLACASGRRAAV